MFKRITKRQCIAGVVTLIILIITFFVIWSVWRDTMEKKPVPLKDAHAAYVTAVANQASAENIHYRVNGKKTTTVDRITIGESFTQIITYEAQNSDHICGAVEETLSIGDYDIHNSRFYADGIGYYTVQNSTFQSEIEADSYKKHNIPPLPINDLLYLDITGMRTGRESVIYFANPIKPESWLIGDNIILIDAHATASINNEGKITSSDYSVTYQIEDIQYSLQIEVEIITNNIAPIELPDISNYSTITDIDAPLMLERACGYILSAKSISSEYSDEIHCQAFGDFRTQNLTLVVEEADVFSACVDSHISVSNSSKTGSVSELRKIEKFTDNLYTSSTNSEEYIENPNVDIAAMRTYCQNLLIRSILLPEYIVATEFSETDDHYSINFKASEEFAQILAQQACKTLYQNELILTNISQTSSTDTVTCYLNIQKNTGLPISSGFQYQGTYTISNIPYQLTYIANQSFHVPVPQND